MGANILMIVIQIIVFTGIKYLLDYKSVKDAQGKIEIIIYIFIFIYKIYYTQIYYI